MAQTKEEIRQYKKEMYDWRKAHGVCTKCGVEDAFNGRTLCLECMFKSRERAAEKYNNRSDVQKEKDNIKRKSLSKRRKEEHKCVTCGKDLPEWDHTHTRCKTCRVKYATRRKNQRWEQGIGVPSFFRYDGQHCRICLKPLGTKSDKLCDACYDRCLLKLDGNQDNEKVKIWKEKQKRFCYMER